MMLTALRTRVLSYALGGVALVTGAAASAQSLDSWTAAIKARHNGTTIRSLAIPHPSSEAMRAMSGEFEKATGIKVVWEMVGSSDIVPKQMLAHTARDTAYDVYMVRGTSLAE